MADVKTQSKVTVERFVSTVPSLSNKICVL